MKNSLQFKLRFTCNKGCIKKGVPYKSAESVYKRLIQFNDPFYFYFPLVYIFIGKNKNEDSRASIIRYSHIHNILLISNILLWKKEIPLKRNRTMSRKNKGNDEKLKGDSCKPF